MRMKLAITKDTTELIGPFAEAVENRSLLLDKFVCHKRWPLEKMDEAARWSFMRVATNGSLLLQRDANEFRRRANGRNARPENQARYSQLADIAERMSKSALNSADQELQQIQTRHASRLISLLQKSKFKSRVLVAKLESRLAINLADGLIQNAGIALHRLFGLPYIPGSAIKGITRAMAYQELLHADKAEQEQILHRFIAIFGTSRNDFKGKDSDLGQFKHLVRDEEQNRKGCISFLPAYALDNTKVVVDITNVHTPDYYRTGLERDLSRENPRPNPFPVVEAGSRFAFGIVLNHNRADESMLEQAAEWLAQGLEIHGIGAKTSSGYGWFNMGATKEETRDLMETANQQAEKLEEEQENAAAERRAIEERERQRAAMSPAELRAHDLWEESKGDAAAFKGLVRDFPNLEETEKKAVIYLCRNQASEIWDSEHAEYQKLMDNPKKQAKSKPFKRVKALLDAVKAMGETL